jgi:hypothetical protein
MTEAAGPTPSSRLEGVALTIVVLVAALLVTSGIGFFSTYFSRAPDFAGSGWQVHFHLATILAWLAILVAQAWLGAMGRLASHRAVGQGSYLLVPLIVVGFVLVALFGQERAPNPALIGAAFFDGTLFTLFYVLAIVKRREPAIHSRYMLLTAVALINAPLGRAIAPQVSVPFELLVIIALLIVARKRGEPWRPFLVGAVSYVVLLGVIMAIHPPS